MGDQGVLDERDGLDAGNFGEAVFDALVEGDVLWRGIAGGRRLNGEEQEVVGVEAEVGGVEVDQRAREEACSDDEEHGERDLEDDDGFAGETFAAAGGGRGGVLERGVDVGASGLPCGGEAEEDAGEDGDCGGEGEDAKVESGAEGRGSPGGGEQVRDDVAAEVAEGETGDASE